MSRAMVFCIYEGAVGVALGRRKFFSKRLTRNSDANIQSTFRLSNQHQLIGLHTAAYVVRRNCKVRARVRC
jgi:hypothetical protein